VAGYLILARTQHLVEGHEMQMGSLKGLDARKALMVMGIMTLHSFSEGLGVGVSYGGQHGRRQVLPLSTCHWAPFRSPCACIATLLPRGQPDKGMDPVVLLRSLAWLQACTALSEPTAPYIYPVNHIVL